MSIFKKLVVDSLLKEGINPNSYRPWKSEMQPRTTEEILDIFCMNKNLTEDSRKSLDNQTEKFLTDKAFEEFLDKLANKDYEQIDDDLYEFNLWDITIQLHTNYKNSIEFLLKPNVIARYDNTDKALLLNTEFNINQVIKIAKDYEFESSFKHEYTHFLDSKDFDGLLPQDYVHYDNEKDDDNETNREYYDQPYEKNAYKAEIVNSLCHYVEDNLRLVITNEEDFKSREKLQKAVDILIKQAIREDTNKVFSTLMKFRWNNESFKKLYEEIIEVCMDYIYHHYNECVKRCHMASLSETARWHEYYLKKKKNKPTNYKSPIEPRTIEEILDIFCIKDLYS